MTYPHYTSNGIEFVVEGEAPNPEKSIELIPNDDGTLDIIAKGPNGETSIQDIDLSLLDLL